jgi:hypothetical protein
VHFDVAGSRLPLFESKSRRQRSLSTPNIAVAKIKPPKVVTEIFEDATVVSGSVGRGINRARASANSACSGNQQKEKSMGSIDIGLADLLEIFAALFGGSSEPEAN